MVSMASQKVEPREEQGQDGEGGESDLWVARVEQTLARERGRGAGAAVAEGVGVVDRALLQGDVTTDPMQREELWSEIGEIYADHLSDPASALEALIGRPVESPRDKIRKKSRRIRSFPDFFSRVAF